MTEELALMKVVDRQDEIIKRLESENKELKSLLVKCGTLLTAWVELAMELNLPNLPMGANNLINDIAAYMCRHINQKD